LRRKVGETVRRFVGLSLLMLALVVLVSPGFPQFPGEVRALGPEGIEGSRSEADVPEEPLLSGSWWEVRWECVVFRGPREIVFGPCTYKWSCAQRGHPFGQDVYEYRRVERCCQAWLYLGGFRVSPLGDPVCEKSWSLEDIRVVCGCVPDDPVPFPGQEKEG